MPTASAGFTSLAVERVIDTDPLNISVTVRTLTELDGGVSETITTMPSFRGTVQRRADPPVRVDVSSTGPVETSDEYVLMASRTAALGEVTTERTLTFTHPFFGELRITNVHPYSVGGEICGYACRLAQVR